MVADVPATDAQFGPWNPGIQAQIPRELRGGCTIFRPENTSTAFDVAAEMHDLTGLDVSDLVAFTPQRLALHELLIRVSADLSVPDGSKIEDLGINFRHITRAILSRYIEPETGAITAAYDAARQALSAIIAAELAALLDPSRATTPAATPRGVGARVRALLGAGETRAATRDADEDRNREQRVLAMWQEKARAAAAPVERAAYRALAKVVSALVVRHGRPWGGRELIAAIATNLACNDYGSEVIGGLVDTLILRAASAESYVLLPWHERPVVMNTKGASASGKSTLRPRQKKLAGDIGLRWSEFALISPDIWRKQLLDYGSLGAAYKYGGAFTGDEVRIIDLKLDRYMARKAERGQMPHLLIDRFRFDSFAPDSDEAGSNLLTRFGHVVYLFFMITPPESLVERAWNRGLEFGRYKAVDDTLAHSIEAYSGMPELFFTWVERKDKRLHFEFLDNSVALGEAPRTVAFGSNDVLNVLDVKSMLDIERFRRVDVGAQGPSSLYRDKALLAPEANTGFLIQCAARFGEINFADQATGLVYLRLRSNVPVWADRTALLQAATDADTHAGLLAVVPDLFGRVLESPASPQYLSEVSGAAHGHTLGRWGPTRAT
jgi:hypothetical protein